MTTSIVLPFNPSESSSWPVRVLSGPPSIRTRLVPFSIRVASPCPTSSTRTTSAGDGLVACRGVASAGVHAAARAKTMRRVCLVMEIVIPREARAKNHRGRRGLQQRNRRGRRGRRGLRKGNKKNDYGKETTMAADFGGLCRKLENSFAPAFFIRGISKVHGFAFP